MSDFFLLSLDLSIMQLSISRMLLSSRHYNKFRVEKPRATSRHADLIVKHNFDFFFFKKKKTVGEHFYSTVARRPTVSLN